MLAKAVNKKDFQVNRSNLKNLAFVVAAASLSITSANADSHTYDVGTGSSVTAYTGSLDGLTISTTLNPTLPTISFTLDDLQSFTFDFFNISTPEGSVEADDKKDQPITAVLNFSTPSTSATITGQTDATTTGFLGRIEEGHVIWDGPETITLGDREFEVTLSDEIFNRGPLFGLGNKGATVEATVEQLASFSTRSVSAPDASSTMALLGGALCALAGLKRRA
jgi:hypothetical protein